MIYESENFIETGEPRDVTGSTEINCKEIFVYAKYSFTMLDKCRFNGDRLRNRPRTKECARFMLFRVHTRIYMHVHTHTCSTHTILLIRLACFSRSRRQPAHRNAVHDCSAIFQLQSGEKLRARTCENYISIIYRRFAIATVSTHPCIKDDISG